MAEAEELQLLAWRAVRRAYNQVVKALDLELEQRVGLSLRAYEVLVLLGRCPDGCSRMSDLAASVLLSPSGLTRLVDQLVARGYVERRQDRTDARGQLAVLSSSGRAACENAIAVYRDSVMEHFGQRLDEGQLHAIADALRAFLADGDGRPSRSATKTQGRSTGLSLSRRHREDRDL